MAWLQWSFARHATGSRPPERFSLAALRDAEATANASDRLLTIIQTVYSINDKNANRELVCLAVGLFLA
jgi:hypothetical protein